MYKAINNLFNLRKQVIRRIQRETMNTKSVTMICALRRIVAVFCLIMGSSLTPATASTVNIQPIQVCLNDSTGCANAGLTLFGAVGNKIWAQAGMDLNFLPFQTLNNTALINLDFDAAFPGAAAGAAAAGTVIKMLFVNTITTCGGAGAGIFGCAWPGANGVAIADNVFAFNGGVGRLDTIAHELGHNLGLGHNDFGAGGALNLMSDGAVRTIPGAIGDVFPDGAKTDQLTAAQITQATASAFVVPVPGALYLMVSGLLVLYQSAQRRAAKS